METIEFFTNFRLDVLYWITGVVTMLGLYELWRRWFVRLWNRRKHRVMEYRYEYRDSVDNKERYVYPKKECECDCLGVDKLEYNGELPDVHLDNKEELIKQYEINVPIKYIGVSKHGKKWQARIKVKGVKTTIGTYDLASQAAIAYNERAKELRGDKAKINTVVEI